ncbi:MAG: CoA transferase, partial [Pseudomonadota bacterium]
VTGEPDAPPTRFGLSMVDFMTGAQLALGCVSAIMRARDTGEGCDVDVSLFDTALHQLSYPGVWAMNGGEIVGRLPRGAHPSIAPSQTVKTKDGWGLLMCQTQKFWELFCDLAEAETLKSDPRFGSIKSRRENLSVLTEEVDKVCGARTTSDWLNLLGGKVPFAPINDLKHAVDNPYVEAIGLREPVAHPDATGGQLDMLLAPIKINGARPRGVRAPKLGEHTEEILGSDADEA